MASAPSSDSSAFRPGDVVAHARFVRALAGELVRDADAADELAARAMAEAIRRRPDTGPGLRVWLRSVVWRMFRRAERDDERRHRRERAAAQPEAQPSTVDLVAQMDLQRQIAEAFTALEEPWKSTLFRRYFHDETPSAIAESTATPLATVKSRLQRGLEQLRVRLDATHHGRREEWLAVLVPWCLIGGKTLVATKSKLVPIAVAAVLVASASLVVLEPWKRGGESDAAATTTRPAVAEGVAAIAAPERETPPALSPERAPVAVDPASLPFAAGVVVDAAGAPLEDVTVVASRIWRGREPGQLAEQHAFEYAAIARDTLARTDARGRFVVGASVGDDLVALWFVKPGFGLGQWWELAAEKSANQDVRVTLTPAQPLRGTVRDSDGRPIPLADVGIGVLLYQGESLAKRVARHLADAPEYTAAPAIGWQRGKADADGRFDLPSVPRGRFTASASADGHGYVALTSEELPDPWNPVLLRSDLLIDIVDADTQQPIRHASAILLARTTGSVLQMALSSWEGEGLTARRIGDRLNVTIGFGEPGTVTNQRGFLEMQRPPWLTSARGETLDVEVRVIADGYRSDFVDVTLSTKSEPPHLRVELVPDDGEPGEAAIAGRVVGAPEAVAAASTEVRAYLLAPGWDAFNVRMAPPLLTTTVAAAGGFAFHELPKGRYLLLAHAKGFAPATLEVEAPCSGALLELRSAAALEVTVVDRTGTPVKGAVVHVQDESGKEARMRATGADGVALFNGMPDGRLHALAFVVPDAAGYASWDRASPIDPGCFASDAVVESRGGETAQLKLALLERLPVRLHFEHDDGTPVAHVALEWNGMENSSPASAIGTEFERLHALTLALDSRGDGTVELYPGSYHFQAAEAAVRRRITIDVPRSGDASLTIKLPNVGPTGSLHGRLTDLASGGPVMHRDVFMSARLPDGEWTSLGTQTSDGDGRFAFAGIPAGGVELRIHADCLGGRGGSLLDDPMSPYGPAKLRATIEAGHETAVEVALPPIKSKGARLPRITLDAVVTEAATGKPIPDATVEVAALLGDTELFAGSAKTGPDGRARADLFAAEKYHVSITTPWGPILGMPKYKWKDLDLAPKDGVLTVAVELEKRP